MGEHEPKLKMKEVAAQIGESGDVLRNWMKSFGEWIPTTKNATGYHEFDGAALGVVREIQELIRKRGYSTRQVAYHLAGGEGPEAAQEATISVQEAGEIRETLRQLAAAQERQNELSEKILETLIAQEKRMEERDRRNMEYMKERLEQQRAALTAPTEPRRPWWKIGRKKGE